jgi:hypothetical protein
MPMMNEAAIMEIVKMTTTSFSPAARSILSVSVAIEFGSSAMDLVSSHCGSMSRMALKYFSLKMAPDGL